MLNFNNYLYLKNNVNASLQLEQTLHTFNIFIYIIYIFYYGTCNCARACVCVYTTCGGQRDISGVSSLFHIGPKTQAQVVRLGSKHIYAI